MAVGKNIFPEMNEVKGVLLGTANAGIKQTERDDILVMQMAEGGTCAAVFTQNAFCAAPVHVAKDHVLQNPRWLLVNSGNANAGTGVQGMQDATTSCVSLAGIVSGRQEQVMPFSTGVIGENLPMKRLVSALPRAVKNLDASNWHEAARAIMTTDTFAKGASRKIEIGGATVTVTGISKGAGMIQPNMATMLAFIATDAKIAQPLLQKCLQDAVEHSFNRITVDGDTSTNDGCVLWASGCASAPEIQAGSEQYERFSEAVKAVSMQLSEAIVRDGEGATKLIRIIVEQAENEAEAVKVAKTIAHSPLVKTAFFAADPNWGRILAAVGRSEVSHINLDKVEIYLDDVCIVENGGRADGYTEHAGQTVMNRDEITVRVVLGRGAACQQVLTCDLSYEYVRINAEYRT